MGLVDHAPRGLSRLLLRAPVLLYRARLGRLLGRRFVYVAHRGRRSGKRREVVLEVVRYDPDLPEVFVVSGWGARSDWYRNLRAHPALEVRIGARRIVAPRQRFLDPEETVRLMLDYRRAHPRAWRRLASLLGLPSDPSQARADARDFPAVAFSPGEASRRTEPRSTHGEQR
jgi:deazaflavin-dependent oxidoreductase (nitroreductase family)